MSAPTKPEPTLRQLLEASFAAWRLQILSRGPGVEPPYFPSPAVHAGIMLATYGGRTEYALAQARDVERYLEAVATEDEKEAARAAE